MPPGPRWAALVRPGEWRDVRGWLDLAGAEYAAADGTAVWMVVATVEPPVSDPPAVRLDEIEATGVMQAFPRFDGGRAHLSERRAALRGEIDEYIAAHGMPE